jgi:nucleoside-diphosphate-sugar epimerase
MAGATMWVGDVRDRVYFRDCLEKEKPDVVVHLAAISSFNPRPPYEQSMKDININGSMRVIEECAKTPFVKRLVIASSSMVYGNFISDPQIESCFLKPINEYGKTKLVSEVYLQDIFNPIKKDWVTIRPSAGYGPTDCNGRVLQVFTEGAMKGEKLQVTKGEVLDFTYVKDIAKGFYLAIFTVNCNDTYNITAGHGRTIFEATQIIKKYFPDIIIEIVESVGDKRPKRGTLSIEKACKKLGYEPKYQLEEGLKEYIEYQKGHYVKV